MGTTLADAGPAARASGRVWPGARYVTEAGARNVLKYRYAGADNSLMYRYFCSPLAEALVMRAVPLWMAPNVITCLGLLPSLLGHALIWHYSPDLVGHCPRWCWAVAGVCTFVYQTLDNMDGKQARRTGSSSPLGLMVDHGIDAFNIVLSSLNVMAMLQVGDSPRLCFLIWLTSSTPFFVATWEEYHTGCLYLGAFNGPTDGVLILAASQLLSAAVEDYGAFWGAEALPGLVEGLSRRSLAIAFYLLMVVLTVVGNFLSVFRSSGSALRLRGAALLLVPFAGSLAGGAAWLLGSASGARAFAASPRLVFWLLGLAFLKLVVHLQLAHICGEAYRPWRRTLLLPALLVSGGVAAGALPSRLQALVDDGLLCLTCVVLLAVSCAHLAVGASRELAEVLGQRVFSISPVASKAS